MDRHGSNIYSDPKWSDPFDEDGGLALVVLPAAMLEVTRTEAESVLPRFGGEGIVTVASGDSSVGPAVARSR